jgi:hypothetical protein
MTKNLPSSISFELASIKDVQFLAQTATKAPSSRACNANAKPIPDEAPVITTTLFLNVYKFL